MCKDPHNGALYERIEELFFHEGLDAYLVTGQSAQAGDRHAYIALKSAHTLTAEQNKTLRATATSFVAGQAGMAVHVDRQRQMVTLYDEFTKKTSEFPVSDLSPAVQEKYPPLTPSNFFTRLGM